MDLHSLGWTIESVLSVVHWAKNSISPGWMLYVGWDGLGTAGTVAVLPICKADNNCGCKRGLIAS
jgi:hypothetical protein